MPTKRQQFRLGEDTLSRIEELKKALGTTNATQVVKEAVKLMHAMKVQKKGY